MKNYFNSKNSTAKLYQMSIENCIKVLEDKYQTNGIFFSFTDHSINHSIRILDKITKLYPFLFSENENALNEEEIYIFIMSAFLHDIGMELINKSKLKELFVKKHFQDEFLKLLANSISLEEIDEISEDQNKLTDFIRKNHHTISARAIIDPRKYDFEIINGYEKIISKVCYAHNENIGIVKNSFYKDDYINNSSVNIKLLAFLLRLGDALDADRKRCNVEVLEIKDISVSSKIHWYKHYYTKEIITDQKSVLCIFEFPEEDNITYLENSIIEDTMKWISTNCEELLNENIFSNALTKRLRFNIDKRVEHALIDLPDKDTISKIKKITSLQISYNLECVKKEFIQEKYEEFNNQLIQNKYDGKIRTKFNEVYVEPRIFNYPENENDESEEKAKRIKTYELICSTSNYIIFGGENYGKTTILRHIFLEKSKTGFSFILDFNELKKDSNNLLYKILGAQISYTYRVPKEDLDAFLLSQNIYILIDNVEVFNKKYFDHITAFIKNYPDIQIIITVLESNKEKFNNVSKGLNYEEVFKCFEPLYIHPFGFKETQQMIKKWSAISDFGRETDVLQSIIKIVFTNRLPRTPFVFSLFLGIMQQDTKFMPSNMYSLLDKFCDVYLGKYNVFDNNVSEKFPYETKVYFLELLASEMMTNNVKILTNEHCRVLMDNFNESIKKIDYIMLFEELRNSKLIIYDGEGIRFSFDCFLYFFYVKYIIRQGKQQELKNNLMYEKFYDAAILYASQAMNDNDLIVTCGINLIDFIKEKYSRYESISEEIDKVYESIDCEYLKHFECEKKSEEDIKEEIQHGEDSKEDALCEQYENYVPSHKISTEKLEFPGLLLLLGEVLKSSEMVNKNIKLEGTNICLQGFSILMHEFFSVAEATFKEKEFTEDSMSRPLIIIMFTYFTQSVVEKLLSMDFVKQSNNKFEEFIQISLKVSKGVDLYADDLKSFIAQNKNEVFLHCLLMQLQEKFLEERLSNLQEQRFLEMIQITCRKLFTMPSKNPNITEISKNRDIDNHISNLKMKRLMYQNSLIDKDAKLIN